MISAPTPKVTIINFIKNFLKIGHKIMLPIVTPMVIGIALYHGPSGKFVQINDIPMIISISAIPIINANMIDFKELIKFIQSSQNSMYISM